LTEAQWRRMLRRRSRKVAITLLSLALGCLIVGRLIANSPDPAGSVELTWMAVLLATSSLIVLVVWMPLRDMYLRRKHMLRISAEEQ
jgi:hypothetical protein